MSEYKFLIVEDDIHTADIMAAYIESDERTVRIAQTAQDCFEEIDAFQPDLILLDHNLPDKPGLDILKQLRGQGWDGEQDC